MCLAVMAGCPAREEGALGYSCAGLGGGGRAGGQGLAPGSQRVVSFVSEEGLWSVVCFRKVTAHIAKAALD